MKTVLVAGGAGFIGANFVRMALARAHWRVVVFDKLSYAGSRLNLQPVEPNPHFKFLLGDITDRKALRAVIADFRPGAILNFAAETHVDRSIDGPRDFLETNVLGTFELLEAARGHYQELSPMERESFRFLHVSTDEVYGSLDDGRASAENDPYAPNSPYAASKASADHFVRAYHETFGLPVLTTNCSNNYGYYQHPEKLIPLVISCAIAGKPIPIYGDGLNVRDWIFVDDHCDALIAVLEHGQPGKKYNIGANCAQTNFALVDQICGILDELSPPGSNPLFKSRGLERHAELISFVTDRPGHDRRYMLDCRLIQRELGWQARVGLAQGLRATVRWYLDNRDWCIAVQRGRAAGERLGLKGISPQTPTGSPSSASSDLQQDVATASQYLPPHSRR